MDTEDLAQHIKDSDLEAYIAARYPAIQEGEVHVYREQDFTGIDMRHFPLSFAVFEHSNLVGVRLHGLPVGLRGCDARNLDVSGMDLRILAEDSDLRGMVYDEGTVLGDSENESYSVFARCKLDEFAISHFKKQGVIFTDKGNPTQRM